MKKEAQKSAIGLSYLEEAFAPEDIVAFEGEARKNGLRLYSKSEKAKCIAGIEELFPHIAISVSPDLVEAFAVNLLSSAIYSGIVAVVCLIRDKLKKKTLFKIQNGKIIENATPTVHLKIGENSIVLPMELSDEKFKYVVDKSLESLSPEKISRKTYTFYEEKIDAVVTYKEEEVTQKFYNEWLAKQSDRET